MANNDGQFEDGGMILCSASFRPKRHGEMLVQKLGLHPCHIQFYHKLGTDERLLIDC
jgi:hypothetical protein